MSDVLPPLPASIYGVANRGTEGVPIPAVCSAGQAAGILAALEDDYLTTQVFLDFARLFRSASSIGGVIHRIPLAGLERHTRFLAASLERISAAFAAVGGTGPLFILTADGALLVHATVRIGIAAAGRVARPRRALAA